MAQKNISIKNHNKKQIYTKVTQEDSQRSTPEVDGGISNANLKSFILFRKLWTEPSEHIF